MKRALFIAVLIGGLAQAQSTRTVTIGLGYIPNVQFTPFYVADKLEYFKAEGINIKYQHGFINELMPLLLQGKLDFVVGDPEDAILAKSQGADIKYIMAMYQKSPVTIFSLKPINNDLKGKTIGIPGPYGSSYYALQALLDNTNLKEGQDVKVASIGYTQLEAVKSGKVDAAMGYINNEVVQLSLGDQKVYTLDPSSAYPMVGAGLIASGKSLSSDIAKKVVRACQRGLKFTIQDPEHAFKIGQAVFGSNGGTLGILKASTPLMLSTYTQSYGIGASNPGNWDKAIAALVKQGKLTAGAKASDFYSNALISKTIK